MEVPEEQSVPSLSPNSYDCWQSSVFLALQTLLRSLLHATGTLLVYSVSRLLSSRKDTVIRLWPDPSPVWPHLELFTPAKALFPKATFTGTGG